MGVPFGPPQSDPVPTSSSCSEGGSATAILGPRRRPRPLPGPQPCQGVRTATSSFLPAPSTPRALGGQPRGSKGTCPLVPSRLPPSLSGATQGHRRGPLPDTMARSTGPWHEQQASSTRGCVGCGGPSCYGLTRGTLTLVSPQSTRSHEITPVGHSGACAMRTHLLGRTRPPAHARVHAHALHPPGAHVPRAPRPAAPVRVSSALPLPLAPLPLQVRTASAAEAGPPSCQRPCDFLLPPVQTATVQPQARGWASPVAASGANTVRRQYCGWGPGWPPSCPQAACKHMGTVNSVWGGGAAHPVGLRTRPACTGPGVQPSAVEGKAAGAEKLPQRTGVIVNPCPPQRRGQALPSHTQGPKSDASTTRKGRGEKGN